MHARLLVTYRPARASLYLAGDFDLTHRAGVRRRVDDAVDLGCHLLEVNAAGVTSMDLGCLAELARARERLAGRGQNLVVREASTVFEQLAVRAGCSELLGPGWLSGRQRSRWPERVLT